MNRKLKKLTQAPLFLPIFSMVLVMVINVFYDIANGNAVYSFFKITTTATTGGNTVLFGRIIDILNRGSEVAILAIGMTLVVAASGGTDISVGSVMSLAGGVCCVMLAGFGVTSVDAYRVPLFVGILAGILVATLCGAMNGFLVSYMKIQPMVATLILFSAGRAIGLLLCNSMIVYIRVESFKFFGGYFGPIPTPIVIAAVCITVTALVLKFTALGTYIQAVGINKDAARISGYQSQQIVFLVFLVCGFFAGIAGIVNTSRIYSADTNNIGLNLELDAILAVALGGNSLGGGRFRLSGSIIGAYTIQAITTTLLALGVSTAQMPVFKALIVVIIVAIQAPAVKAYFARRSVMRAERAVKGGVRA